jgi:hypothetical protein
MIREHSQSHCSQLIVDCNQRPALSQRSSAHKKYYSYQYVETMSMGSMSSTTTVRAVNPDKYRMVTKTVSGEGWRGISQEPSGHRIARAIAYRIAQV